MIGSYTFNTAPFDSMCLLQTPLSVQNFILYSYGVPLNLLAYWVSSLGSGVTEEDEDYDEEEKYGIFHGYNTWTVIIILTQVGGQTETSPFCKFTLLM